MLTYTPSWLQCHFGKMLCSVTGADEMSVHQDKGSEKRLLWKKMIINKLILIFMSVEYAWRDAHYIPPCSLLLSPQGFLYQLLREKLPLSRVKNLYQKMKLCDNVFAHVTKISHEALDGIWRKQSLHVPLLLINKQSTLKKTKKG